MKNRALLAVFACSTLLFGTARAQDKDAVLEEARQHVAKAKVHYDLGEYKEAADEYILVYRLRPIPALLFNIAQAYRQGGLYDKARQFYKAYLRESPDAKNRPLIEQNIREMDDLLAKERHTKDAAPTGVKEAPEASLPIKSAPAKVADAPKPAEPTKVAEAPKPADSSKPSDAQKPAADAAKTADAAKPSTPAAARPEPAKVADAPKPAVASTPKPAPTTVAMATPRPSAPVEATPGTSAPHPEPAVESSDAIYTKWWFWTAVGVVAVGGGVAAMTLGGNTPPASHFGTNGI